MNVLLIEIINNLPLGIFNILFISYTDNLMVINRKEKNNNTP